MPAASHGNRGQTRPFRPETPLVIGLVGGIASGKSKVASLFASHGIRSIDADFHSRAASEDPEVLTNVAEQLGERFVRDGQLDRAALADHVFADPAAKARLEAILHPRVRARILSELESAREQGLSVLLDVPLLFEAGLFALCDTIVFVDTADSVRQARARTRGWAEHELQRREQNQLPLAEKRARSQHVIDNNGDLMQTSQAVDELLRQLESRS
jgi:dephospho-CoA kinase